MDNLELAAASSAQKSGDSIITTVIRRSLGGVSITVHAHAKVEEFMKSMGSGELIDTRTMSRMWDSVSKDQPLFAYHINTDVVPTNFPKFCLNRIGGDLEISSHKKGIAAAPRPDGLPPAPPPDANPVINLSYLRLQGISSDKGVTFRYGQVYTPEGLIRLRDLIVAAQNEFHATFLKPIVLSVQMVSQDF